MDNFKKKSLSTLNSITNPETNLNKNKEFSIFSESIVSCIIDRLISLTISENLKNNIEKNIPSKCFNFMTDIINNYLKIEFLSYDRDDLFLTLEEKQQKESIKNIHNINSNYFLNRTFSKNEIIKPLNTTSMDEMDNSDNKQDLTSNNILDNDFLEINEQNENLSIDHSILYYDNNYIGINEWNLCPEPV